MGVICFMSCHNKADRPEKSFPALFAYRKWRGIFRTVTIIKLFVSAFYFSPGEEICVCVSAVWCRCTTTTKGAFDAKELTAKCDVYIYVNIAETLCPMELYHRCTECLNAMPIIHKWIGSFTTCTVYSNQRIFSLTSCSMKQLEMASPDAHQTWIHLKVDTKALLICATVIVPAVASLWGFSLYCRYFSLKAWQSFCCLSLKLFLPLVLWLIPSFLTSSICFVHPSFLPSPFFSLFFSPSSWIPSLVRQHFSISPINCIFPSCPKTFTGCLS